MNVELKWHHFDKGHFSFWIFVSDRCRYLYTRAIRTMYKTYRITVGRFRKRYTLVPTYTTETKRENKKHVDSFDLVRVQLRRTRVEFTVFCNSIQSQGRVLFFFFFYFFLPSFPFFASYSLPFLIHESRKSKILNLSFIENSCLRWV